MCRGHFLTACIGIFLSWHYHVLSVATEPGFLDFDNLPETNFSCEGKVIGGYYADTETGCQMFHVCTIGQKGEITDIKFLCLNGTVFDQETRVCERLDEVDCSKSESFYDLNLELYGNNGAGYGIQPENEDVQEDQLCQEEDEEDCKTEKPSAPSKPIPTEQVHASSEETEEDETTTQPFLSSTTSRRPVITSTSVPSTTPAPQILQFPSSSPETIAALLALHKAFTQSLQQHSNNKDAKVNLPKLTGFVESLDPIKATQQAETFEIDSESPSPPPRLPTPFPTKTKFSVPQNQPKPQFASLPKPLFQNPVKPQYQSPTAVKQDFQTQQKPQFQNSQKSQYQPNPKPPPPLPLPPISFPKPIQTTSEGYGNGPFHHSFHINSQVGHFPDPNYQDHYADRDTQSSSQSQTEAPKQYDFDYDDDYYDEKPHSSTITPYQLHQLKVNQVKNANQANAPSSNHGSFVREVSSPAPTKAFNVPTYRSVTPSIAIITATSTTSSSSVKTSKPVQSAILSSKETSSAAGFTHTLNQRPSSNTTHQSFQDHPQSYDYYTEGDVRSDPFYKDVPKIGRSKRSLENNLVSDSTVTFLDYASLTKLKDNLLNSVFKNNSQTILSAILQQYCNDSSSSSIAYCLFVRNSNVSDVELGENWKVVVPKDNSDYIYLIKTIISSNEYENSTSNILVLVNFPDEFKLIRDSILRSVRQYSTNIVKDVDLNNINSSMRHRFKRTKRNKLIDNSLSRKSLKTALKTMKKLKKKRKRRQTNPSESDEIVSVQQDNFRVRPRSRPRELSQVVVRRRPAKVLDSAGDSEETRTQTRPGQRRPSSRRQPQQQSTSESPVQYELEERKVSQTPHSDIKTSSSEASTKASTSTGQVNQDKLLGRPSSRRRGQGVRYHFSENPQPKENAGNLESSSSGGSDSSSSKDETSTVYPFNLKPGTQFSCDDKIKGGYYADIESECYGYFICSQGEINGPLLKSHFWCGPTTKFNQRSRTCQVEANVACAVSKIYFHLNKDILSLPDPDVDVKDTFEPSKVKT